MSGTHPALRFSPWAVCALALLVAALLALSCGQPKVSTGPQGSGRAPAASPAVQDETPARHGTVRAAVTEHRAAEPPAVPAAVPVEGPAKPAKAFTEASAEVSGDAAGGSSSCSQRDDGPDAQIRPGTGTGESAVAPGGRDRSAPVAPDVRSPKVGVHGLLVHPPPSFTVLRI